ncbi:DUF3667 domain-containing protein [Colwellia hornerae]|uniref:DUF3667 domain-containing protein n=1 Tax=Colwellia hornerae TaxID=89402 RepID=A0A5C6QE54_9GAMM|nr:DUF3667 domain-containing protein [Colwellia hornerae]TWX51672.1 DUF3667 domain-containing protein [Colwellia hornerae]TWX57460.1 DUF3667 domain-containing protein [Colwellia hornerae]TWX66963.1 DUF3667 domain-containing protein [Colwellia hornerae]
MQNAELVEKNSDVNTTLSLPKQPDNFKSSANNHCDNCHQPLNGPFCAQCGQQAESTLKYFWVVILHLLDDIFSFDSRAVRTILPLVTRPGFLTNEYIAGKRVHYVPPLRLYLFVSIVFFITLKFFVLADSNKILTVSDNQTSITQIKDQLVLLEKNKLKAMDASPINTVDLLVITKSITKFETFLKDINKDYSIEINRPLVDMTKELVDLELEQFKDEQPLSGHKKERYDLLTSNITKFKNGETLDKVDKAFTTIGNNVDGSLSFDFLSEDSNKKLNAFAESLIKKAEKAFHSDTAPLVQEVIGKLPQLMFVLLPIFAVLLKIMFMFSKRLYMEHLTVALHSHSFIFFTILLVELLDVFAGYSETALPVITGAIEFASKALLTWIPIYLFIMQKRVYKQGYFFTFIKYSLIGTAYMILIGFTGVIAFVWGLTDI